MATIIQALTAAGVLRSLFYAGVIAFLDLMLLVASVRLLSAREWFGAAVAVAFTVGLALRLWQQIRQIRRAVSALGSTAGRETEDPTA